MSAIPPQDKLKLLRELLLAEERHDITALREEIEKLEQTVDERTGKSLVDSLREQSGAGEENFESYVAALQSGTESAIERSVRTNKTRLAAALFPIMGPAIRSYVTELFRSMAEDLNRTLQNATSVERIRWRFQARMTGVPFSEYVALRTANFRVEELYLMEKQTGLLIQHLTADPDHEALKDPDLMSGMLTAIRSFTRDVFAEDNDGDGEPDDDEELNRFTFGGRQVLIEGAPTMILAAVVRGNPPTMVRDKMRVVLEALHQGSGDLPNADEGQLAEREDLLSSAMLEAHAPVAESSGGGMWRAWLFLGILGACLAAWLGYRIWDGKRWQAFADDLRERPGIEVLEADRHRVVGLRDPMAADPLGLAPDRDKAELTFVPYHSLEPEFVERREQLRADELAELRTQSAEALNSAVSMGENVAGALEKLTTALDETDRKLADAEAIRRQQVLDLLTSRYAHVEGLEWQFGDEGIAVAGGVHEPFYSQMVDQLATVGSLGGVDTSGLENLSKVTLQGVIDELGRSLILYESGTLNLLAESASVAKLKTAIAKLDEIAAAEGRSYRLTVLSHPLIGANREANTVIEQQRADDLRRRLVEAGIAADRLTLELSNDLTKAGLGVEVVPVRVNP